MPDNALLTFILSFIGAGGGAYLGAYLKKKGENLATHEDLDKLVVQMAAVTKTTKQIEAQISNDLWDRQKRWELKRDAFFETMRELGTVESSIVKLSAVQESGTVMVGDIAVSSHQVWKDALNRSLEAYHVAYFSFNRAKRLGELVCEVAVAERFHETTSIITKLGMDASDGPVPNRILRLVEMGKALEALTEAIREELGLKQMVTPQSSVSSAAQAPAPPAQG